MTHAAPPNRALWALRRPLVPLFACLVTIGPAPGSSARADDEPIPREVEYAVDHGLEWLAKTQDARSGGWGSTQPTTAAITGLAAMAFMARGHVPGEGPYGDTINRAVDNLLARQNPAGIFSAGTNATMYEQGICTVALCETYGMLDDRRQPACRTAISKAVRVILDAQNRRKSPDNQGGWRYTPESTDSDISVTGWQLMALRGASNAGANIPQSALDAGIAYIKRRAVFGGGFAYQGNGGPNAARTGTGILALSLMGQPDAPEVKAGGDYLLRTQIGPRDSNYFYAVYYCSQAAWQLGGKYWGIINPPISASIRAKQRSDGSWSGAGDSGGNDSYATAMAILALTVPYRYLPIYQR